MHYAIIAAGEGSRLVCEGVECPKPLVKLNGVAMIDRLIGIMSRCRAESIAVIVNEQMVAVRDYLSTIKVSVPLHVVVKSTPSSMHSFYEVSRAIPGEARKFVLTTVDTVFDESEFSHYVDSFEQDDDIDCLMGVTGFVDDEKPLYVETDSYMSIVSFRDEPYDGVKYVSGGIYGLKPSALAVLNRCVERDISRMRNFQRALIADGLKLKAYPFGKIVDVDHLSDIKIAESIDG